LLWNDEFAVCDGDGARARKTEYPSAKLFGKYFVKQSQVQFSIESHGTSAGRNGFFKRLSGIGTRAGRLSWAA
jgi:hypothetical protein